MRENENSLFLPKIWASFGLEESSFRANFRGALANFSKQIWFPTKYDSVLIGAVGDSEKKNFFLERVHIFPKSRLQRPLLGFYPSLGRKHCYGRPNADFFRGNMFSDQMRCRRCRKTRGELGKFHYSCVSHPLFTKHWSLCLLWVVSKRAELWFSHVRQNHCFGCDGGAAAHNRSVLSVFIAAHNRFFNHKQKLMLKWSRGNE